MHANDKSVAYIDSFGVEHIPKEIKRFISSNNIITNTLRIQAYDSFYVDTFPLYLLVLCSKAKDIQILQTYSCHTISKRGGRA